MQSFSRSPGKVVGSKSDPAWNTALGMRFDLRLMLHPGPSISSLLYRICASTFIKNYPNQNKGTCFRLNKLHHSNQMDLYFFFKWHLSFYRNSPPPGPLLNQTISCFRFASSLFPLLLLDDNPGKAGSSLCVCPCDV